MRYFFTNIILKTIPPPATPKYRPILFLKKGVKICKFSWQITGVLVLYTLVFYETAFLTIPTPSPGI